VLINAIMSSDHRRAAQPLGFGYACYEGEQGAEAFEGVCIGVAPTLIEATAFLDGEKPALSYMAYEGWQRTDGLVN